MSEMAPEPQPQRKGLKGALTRKIGPLPTWGWVVVVAALIFAWAWWRNRQGGTQQAAATVGAGQVPQFVNQTFTSPTPPPAADQDQDEDKDRKAQPPHEAPIPMPPNPKRPPDRDRPPFGEGRPPIGPNPPHWAGGKRPPRGRGEPPPHRRRRHERAA